MEEEKKVYISGAISGLPLEEAKANFRRAKELVESWGFIAVSPFDSGVADSEPWHVHMLADLEMLSKCTHIYLMDGWTKSRGANIEHDFAQAMGLAIFYGTSR